MKFLALTLLLSANLCAIAPGWFSDREYENVSVTFEYKLAQWSEAAFVLRTPKIGRPVSQGVAIFLAHDFHQQRGLYTTGALAGKQAPLRLLPPTYDVWHKASVRLQGSELQVDIDGETLQLAYLPPEKCGKGWLHFADLHHKYEVRNWRIEDLGASLRYVEDFSPYTLRGAGGRWQLGKDDITGSDGHGIQYGAPELRDFVFSAEVFATNRANGGLFFRGSPKESEARGFEVQVYSPLDSVYPTGSIYAKVRSAIASDTEAKWFHLLVLVRGSTCRVWVDGVLVSETDAISETGSRIGFQIHMEKAAVQWRSLRAWRISK